MLLHRTNMSTEYLSNVGDVDDIFQDSMMTCLELSSQIINLTDTEINIPRREAQDLLHIKNRLKRTLKTHGGSLGTPAAGSPLPRQQGGIFSPNGLVRYQKLASMLGQISYQS